MASSDSEQVGFKKYAKNLSEIIIGEQKWTVGTRIIYLKGAQGEMFITDSLLSSFKDTVSKRLEELNKLLKKKNLDAKVKRDYNREAKELRRCNKLLAESRVAGRISIKEEHENELPESDSKESKPIT